MRELSGSSVLRQAVASATSITLIQLYAICVIRFVQRAMDLLPRTVSLVQWGST